jgi:AAA domain
LTTKEGWRRFVDRQPRVPDQYNAATVEMLAASQRDAYDEMRRVYHADLPLANTPTIQKVISTARLLVQLNRNQVSARRGLIVSGASGTGKTTALTQLGRTHERRIRKRYPTDKYRLPVLYVTVPPAATARMLAVEFARLASALCESPKMQGKSRQIASARPELPFNRLQFKLTSRNFSRDRTGCCPVRG